MRRWYQNLGGRVESLMTPRALILRHVDSHIDALHCKDHDAALARALGLFLSACLILAWATLRVLDKIGA